MSAQTWSRHFWISTSETDAGAQTRFTHSLVWPTKRPEGSYSVTSSSSSLAGVACDRPDWRLISLMASADSSAKGGGQ